jgi:hypothetical protein
MKNLFNSIKLQKPKNNKFDLTHDVKMSGKMGNLIPSLVMECVPGDKIKLASDSLIRFAPLIAPVMHRMDVTVHYFFVPNRITWPGWEDFITQQSNTGMPTIASSDELSTDQQKFMDYMGVPPCPTGGIVTEVNALPFAAYQMIYNEYYRDQNLIPEVNFTLEDGLNVPGDLLTLRKRAWEHDYFSASLPFAQKGAAVDIPLGVVELDPEWDGNSDTRKPYFKYQDGVFSIGATGQVDNAGPEIQVNSDGLKTAYDPDGTLQVEPTTINELRRAFRLQEWLEKNARGGTRYIESILSHFGVRSSDKRLQRPEYITGVKSPVIISEVLNTTGQDGGLPQGNMAGHAVSVQNGNVGSYYCEEHGYIIGIMSIMPKPAYQQGIPKTYLKRDSLDYFWPSFAHIGEQAVQQQEIYAYTSINEETFGYIPRYAEYKYMPSRVAGDFRTSLNYWHLGRIFGGNPLLNQDFIEVDPQDATRIFAVEGDEDNLYIHHLNKIQAIRPMPVFGTPSF